MKKILFPYFKNLGIITLFLVLLSILVNKFLIELNITLIMISLLYFVLLSSALFYFSVVSLINSPKKFASRLMVSMAIKLFSSIIYFAVMAFSFNGQIKVFTIWFLIFYLIYHFNYSLTLNTLNKKYVE